MSGFLVAEPLTSAAFEPFGSVISADPATGFDINSGYTTRFHNLAKTESDQDIILSIFRGRLRPLNIEMLERHPKGTQAFMPLGGRPWIAIVAQKPEPSACRMFLCRGDQGLQYGLNVWHHPLMVLHEAQDFLVVDRQGEGANLEEVFFDEALALRL